MKKTTKKISAVALALVMGATAFTGCSGSTNSTPGGTDSAIMNGLTAIRSSLRTAHGDMKKPGESSRRKTSGKMMR